MPSVLRHLETALYVDDIARSAGFYERLFGFAKWVEDGRFAAFDIAGQQVLLLFRKRGSLEPQPMPGGGFIPPHDGEGTLHLAFAIAREDLSSWESHLGELGIAIESRVTWPKGGISLYFRDPDGHLVELATPGLWPTW